jgi:hypothetical protein
MNTLGKSLVVIGIVIVALGAALLFFSRFKIPFLGRLPGDILVEKKNFTFYFPLATSLLLSAVLSIILYAISKLRR